MENTETKTEVTPLQTCRNEAVAQAIVDGYSSKNFDKLDPLAWFGLLEYDAAHVAILTKGTDTWDVICNALGINVDHSGVNEFLGRAAYEVLFCTSVQEFGWFAANGGTDGILKLTLVQNLASLKPLFVENLSITAPVLEVNKENALEPGQFGQDIAVDSIAVFRAFIQGMRVFVNKYEHLEEIYNFT